jgi:Amt family ammonium transporter
MIGRRLGYPTNVAPPHNLPFAVLGAGLLWFGWFGFNAGSALGAGAIAGGAFVATHLAGSAAGLAWALIEWMHNGRPTVLGIITGSVAGLAAVTPASGFVRPTGAIWIGIGAAALCYYTAVILKAKFGYDDTLDAFGVHGVGGIWGVIATGLFATKAVNAAGGDGLFYGGGALLGAQVKGTLVCAGWSLVGTFAILKALDLAMGLRVSEHEERVGLDLTGHRESAYTLLD